MSDKLIQKLKTISLFSELQHNTKALSEILSIAKIVSFKKNQVIFYEGDHGNCLYIPISGSFEILKKTLEGDTYTVSKLTSDTPVFFGELALIDDDRRSATVVALDEGESLVLEKARFDEFSKKHPELALPIVREISKTLAARLRKTTDDMLKIFQALVEEIRD
jgi:CRP-like cAMP-binding protein